MPTHSKSAAPNPTVVVMAKPAVAGKVKTRLAGSRGETNGAEMSGGEITNAQAAQVHRALVECVLGRVESTFESKLGLMLAVDGGLLNPEGAISVEASERWQVVDQGGGDLGQRLGHVWQAIGGGPVIFLGADSPDLPTKMLRSAALALAEAEAAIGPSDDGGYWTLAANSYTPALLRNIDWGGPNVYDQTCAAADHAELTLATLATWDDVDHHADLARLFARIADADDPALQRLRQRLGQCCAGFEDYRLSQP